MSREILQKLTADFDLHKFQRFFSEKNRKFKESHESLDVLADNMFAKGQKLGMLSFDDGCLMVFAIEAKKELSERSGKKAQYELGKKILKSTQMDAGIFIFYNQAGSFRFSLIYANYLGKKRDWSVFRRFTYFVSKELSNKTFLQRIGDGDFSSLAKIKDAFSVDKVTKEFYQDIANWYFWAIENCRFPKDAEEEPTGRNIAVIRLITRMIFIWFMRERGLVPRGLFEESKVDMILKKLPSDESTYYLAILQNLFFATLSTKQEDRRFRSEVRGNKGINPDFGIQNVYRYLEYFRNPEKIEDYFGEIPFLNGGLFECLDDKPNGVYIDGFTATKKHQPEVPNVLFFSDDRKADLNAIYGTKGKTYKVKGLMNILSSYNFTIDENSLDDQDIALDPELLGRVFENLLASYNPETSTTARKATGSYYTPREIVDYMVTESLKAYFKTHLTEIEDLDKKLTQLLSTASNENPFTKKESNHVVELIESVRIVDPAVGSGAFPMGALNKLVFILGKLDPGNELWKQAQLSAADTIPDPRVRKEAKSRIEEFFKAKNADYGRKLYLIQKCIYGVDIQEIAVEIAKLRFFISLLVDEKIDPQKDNMGIEPLPNLDFKIMQGNSLISEFMGIDFDNGHDKKGDDGQGLLEIATPDDGLTKEFERKKIDFQNEPNGDKKKALKDEIQDLMIKIFEARLQKKYAELKIIENKAKSIPNSEKRAEFIKNEKAKFSKKLGFDLDNIEKQLRVLTSRIKTKPFFPWRLYFAEVFEKRAFDIVIGNPPYGYRDVLSPEEKRYFRTIENIEFSSGDSAELFSKKCFDKLVRNKGFLSFIIPKKSLYGDAWEGFRKHYWLKYDLKYLLDSSKAFDNVLLEMNVFGLKKDITLGKTTCGFLKKDNTIIEFAHAPKEEIFSHNHTAQLYKLMYPSSLMDKISYKKAKGHFVVGELGLAIGTDFYSDKETAYKLLKGIDIDRWMIKDNRWLKNRQNLNWDSAKIFLKPKIIAQRLIAHIENPTPHIRITACYDKEGIIITNTLISFKLQEPLTPEFWLTYLNSTFLSWYAYNFIYARAIRGMDLYDSYIQHIPIPESIVNSRISQKPFIVLANKILSLVESKGYSNNYEKQQKVFEYERQIDGLVYELYDLTPEEIAVVEGRK